MEKYIFKEKLSHGTTDFPIAVYNEEVLDKNGYIGSLHYHKEFELLICTFGSMCVKIEDEEFQLSKGEGVFINSEFLHSISSDKKFSFTAIVFDFTIICSQKDRIFNNYVQPLINNIVECQLDFANRWLKWLKRFQLSIAENR